MLGLDGATNATNNAPTDADNGIANTMEGSVSSAVMDENGVANDNVNGDGYIGENGDGKNNF